MSKLDDLFKAYLRFHTLVSDCQEGSLALYETRIRLFLASLPEGAGIDAFTRDAFVSHLLTVAESSRHSMRLSYYAIRHFARYLVEENHLSSAVNLNMKLEKLEKTRRAPVPVDTVITMLATCEELPRDEAYRALARVVISLLFQTGFRNKELITLRCCDVDFVDKSITTHHAKGGKVRTVYPHADAFKNVRAWLEHHPCVCESDAERAEQPLCACRKTGLLFMHEVYPGKIAALPKEGLYRIIDNIQEAANIRNEANVKTGRFVPHAFRHCHATHLNENGADIVAIQAELGHSNLAITSEYLHANKNRQRALAFLGGLPASQPSSGQCSPPESSRPLKVTGPIPVSEFDQPELANPPSAASMPPTSPQPEAPTPLAQTARDARDLRQRLTSNGKRRRISSR